MTSLSLLILSIFDYAPIPEVKISDQGITYALNAYVDSISAENPETLIDFHMSARVEKMGSSNILYVGSTISIGSFKFGIPVKYSRLGKRLVFWYEDENKIESHEQFNQIQKQFGEVLLNDLNEDGSINTNFNPAHLDFYSFHGGTYRFVLKDGFIKSTRKVCRFPDTSFYKKGYRYDKNGDLIYQEGVYDICSLDQGTPYCSYSYLEYFEKNGMSPIGDQGVSAELTIGKTGRVVKAEVLDKNGKLKEEIKHDYLLLMLKMPPWNPGKLKGKIVSYKIKIVL